MLKLFTQTETSKINEFCFEVLGNTGRYPQIKTTQNEKLEICGTDEHVGDAYFIVVQKPGNKNEGAVEYISVNSKTTNVRIHVIHLAIRELLKLPAK